MAEEKARPPNIPSGLYGKSTTPALPASGAKPVSQEQPRTFFPIGGELGAVGKESRWPMIIAVAALMLSVLNFWNGMGSASMSKADVAAIALDLERLSERNIVAEAPVDASIFIDKTIPLSEAVSDRDIPVDILVPLTGPVYGTSQSLGPIRIDLNESIPVRITLPLRSSAFSQASVVIKREIPVRTFVSARVSIGGVYGEELRSIIGKLRNASK